MAITLTVLDTVASAAVGDPYKFTKAVPDTPTSWLDKFSSVWLAQAINYGAIDGVNGKWNTEGDPRIRAR